MAGEVAHDFNNIMTVVIGHLSLMDLDPDLPESCRERVRTIERATDRARNLTEQLQAFSRAGEMKTKVVDLTVVVTEAAQAAVTSLPGMRVEMAEHEPLWAVEADKFQIGQVIRNLAANAVQAMNQSGTIQLSGRNELLGSAKGPLEAGARVVRFTVADSGSGIAPENLAKIFDPFFTTRKDAAGLGLATAHAIVQRHGGFIEAESVPGQGATFHVYLPAVAAAPQLAHTRIPFLVPNSAQRVLVMDNDAAMRDLLTGTIRALGLEVETTSNGWEATERFLQARQEGRAFQAVIFEVRAVHGMGGAETIHRLRRIDPELKAIVVSGSPDDPVMLDFRQAGFDAAVSRPFGVEDLRGVIRRLVAA
jgi:CheY-like chemotaxis protein